MLLLEVRFWLRPFEKAPRSLVELKLNSTLLKYPPLSFFNIDIDPCLNVQCPRFGVCKAYNAYAGRCECNDQCPSYQDPVCSASGTTYDNQCWQRLGYCKGLENDPRIYHPGSCEGKQDRKLPLLRSAVIDTDISPRLACIDMNSIYYDVLKLEINLSLTFVYKCGRFWTVASHYTV